MQAFRVSALFAFALCSAPVHAALWSIGNEVVRNGDKVVLTLSFTGDQRAAGAQVDVTIPRGFAVTLARPLNGGACAVLPNPNPAINTDLVRAITYASWGPLPAQAMPQCAITVVANAGFGDWFRLAADLCIDGAAQPYPCVLDPGYVTVLP